MCIREAAKTLDKSRKKCMYYNCCIHNPTQYNIYRLHVRMMKL